jgi:hypothetical protein
MPAWFSQAMLKLLPLPLHMLVRVLFNGKSNAVTAAPPLPTVFTQLFMR